MDIVFIRHGSTKLNHKGIYVGNTNVGLSEDGKSEIKKLSKGINNVTFDKIYCSPLIRARETAEILSKKKYILDDRIKEINFGIFEGLNYSEICEKYPMEAKAWSKDYLNYKIPEGESLMELFKRVEEFVEELNENKYEKILVITHGGVISCALSNALNSKEYFYKFKVLHGKVNVIASENNYMYIKGINCTQYS